MKQEINKVLSTLNIQPVLMDIGASGGPQPIWQPIAKQSICIGFDPDQAVLSETPEGHYARSIIINKAVMSAPDQSEAHFYITHSPYCSSTLIPDGESLDNYLFSDLFVVENETSVPASDLRTVLDQIGLQSVDWFKTDTQGTDLRLYLSLPEHVRNRVLAVDIEPGLIDAYQGEDLFVDAHRELVKQGFWLSSLDVKGAVRMNRSTLQTVIRQYPKLENNLPHQLLRPSPAWCEARYLRSIKSLQMRNAEQRDYALLWVFSMVQRQFGFALDIACAYEQRFVGDPVTLLLRELPFVMMERENRTLRSTVKRFLPNRFKRMIRQLAQG